MKKGTNMPRKDGIHEVDAQILEQVRKFIEEHVVLTKKGRRCVDGRYDDKESEGTIARPGGDAGYILVLLALNEKQQWGLTAEQCYVFVKEFLQENDENFYFHTDHHTEEHHHADEIGCGHLAKAVLYPEQYSVNADVTKSLIELLNSTKDEGNVCTSLHGDHQEKGVIIVTGDSHTILPQDVTTGEMYFVYDQTRDIAFMKKLVAFLQEKHQKELSHLSADEFLAMSQLQLGATLELLAHGKDIFSVNVDGSIKTCEYAGFVQA